MPSCCTTGLEGCAAAPHQGREVGRNGFSRRLRVCPGHQSAQEGHDLELQGGDENGSGEQGLWTGDVRCQKNQIGVGPVVFRLGQPGEGAKPKSEALILEEHLERHFEHIIDAHTKKTEAYLACLACGNLPAKSHKHRPNCFKAQGCGRLAKANEEAGVMGALRAFARD